MYHFVVPHVVPSFNEKGGLKCVKADSDFKNMDDRKANPDYLSVIQKKYIKKLGEIKEVDFTYNAQSVKNKINKKVEKVTRGNDINSGPE